MSTAKKQLPVNLYFTEDGRLLVKVDERWAGQGDYVLKACELFGFGLGDFETPTWDDLDANDGKLVKESLVFELNNDTDFISVCTDDSSENSTLMPLCNALAHFLRTQGMVTVALQFYRTTPKQKPDPEDRTCSTAFIKDM